MAAELITPADDLTGLPLPIMPTAEVLPLNTGEVANWHHQFHPKPDPILKNTLGGKALRSARIQLVPAEHHNFTETAYHRFYAGPVIPEEPGEQFGMCALAVAGYIPDEAIDVSEGEPLVKTMEPWQFERLRMQAEFVPPEPDEVERYRIRKLPAGTSFEEADSIFSATRRRQAELSYRNLHYGYGPMRDFFEDYVLGQDVSHASDQVDMFKLTGNEASGMQLLEEAIVQAVEAPVYLGRSVKDVYKAARAAGKLNPRMPASVADLVTYKLGGPGMLKELLPAFRERLQGGEDDIDLAQAV